MARLTAQDFAPELLELYDGYAHGKLNRREFLDRAALFTFGGLTASALLAALSPNYALAEQVKFTDPDIVADYVTYPSPKGNGTVRGYRVRPAKAAGKLPAVVVVHENRGLNPYIEDVARRLAKAGFIALAPDGLSSVGGYPGNDEKGVALQQTVDPTKLMNDFFAAIEWLMHHDDSTGKVGITGFCYGGGVTNAAAVAYPELGAAVSFYGRQPQAQDVPRIKAPIMLHFGELDTRINEGWPAYEQALKAAGTTYEAFIYKGANHGFHNDSTPRYDEDRGESGVGTHPGMVSQIPGLTRGSLQQPALERRHRRGLAARLQARQPIAAGGDAHVERLADHTPLQLSRKHHRWRQRHAGTLQGRFHHRQRRVKHDAARHQGVGRQAGGVEPQAPFIGAVGTQQGVFQQVTRGVQLLGKLGHAQHGQRRFQQWAGVRAVPGAGTEANRVIQAFGGNIDAVVMGGQAQVNKRVACVKVRQTRQQPSHGKGTDRADRKHLTVVAAFELAQGGGDAVEGFAQHRQQRFAFAGEHEPPRQPLEQGDIQLRFQAFDLMADGRLGHA